MFGAQTVSFIISGCPSFTLLYVCIPLCKINYRRQVDAVDADDIILTDITDNEQGQLTFTMHIQVNNGTGVLSASTLQESIEVCSNGSSLQVMLQYITCMYGCMSFFVRFSQSHFLYYNFL